MNNLKKTLITAMTFGAALTACQPEPIPTPEPPKPKPIPERKTEQIDITRIDDFASNMGIGSKTDVDFRVTVQNNLPTDAMGLAKTLVPYNQMDLLANHVQTQWNDKGIVLAPDMVISPNDYRDAGKPKIVSGGMAASRADSVAFKSMGVTLNVKRTDVPETVISLTAQQAMDSVDALVAEIPKGTPFKLQHNGHVLTVKSIETLKRLAHPSAPVPNADGWSDTDPKYAEFYNIYEWSVDTLGYVANRIWASKKSGVSTKVIMPYAGSDMSAPKMYIGNVTSKNIFTGFVDVGGKTGKLILLNEDIHPTAPVALVSNAGEILGTLPYNLDMQTYSLLIGPELANNLNASAATGAQRAKNIIAIMDYYKTVRNTVLVYYPKTMNYYTSASSEIQGVTAKSREGR